MEKIPKQNFSREKYEEVRSKITKYNASLDDDGMINFMDLRTRQANDLSLKYPDARGYAMYHALIGSTGLESFEIEHEDFPGEDSIELFIDNLISGR